MPDDDSGYDGPWTDGILKFNNDYFKNLMTLQWEPRNWDGPMQVLGQPYSTCSILVTTVITHHHNHLPKMSHVATRCCVLSGVSPQQQQQQCSTDLLILSNASASSSFYPSTTSPTVFQRRRRAAHDASHRHCPQERPSVRTNRTGDGRGG
jgi:hypothetical protein